MITRVQMQSAQQRAAEMLASIGINLTATEHQSIEVAEFGSGELERNGLELVVYVNTDRYCAKELILFPHQTCPKHRHPPTADNPGKMETFRRRWGNVFLYIEGEQTAHLQGKPPVGSEPYYT